MNVKFCPIASGSSGNSLYIGTKYTNILIDAGVSGKRLIEGLFNLKITGADIDAIFITHEHKDHIIGAGAFSRKFDIPIYATPGTWEGMRDFIGKIPQRNVKYIYPDENFIINDMCIRPFEIPHDAKEPVGFNVFAGEYKLTAATDIGHASPKVKEGIEGSDVLLIEANHDVEMLKNGSYPQYLKRRILSDLGHMSNETAGELLLESITGKLKYIYLGHLSAENNRPQLAYETVKNILLKDNIKIGTYFKMDLAARYSVSCPVEL